jgi:hypothetical protein
MNSDILKFNIHLKEENGRWCVRNKQGYHSWQISFDEYEKAYLFLMHLVKDEIHE